MVSRCDIGFHKWDGGCECTVCGARRDEHHRWNGCKCEVCGQQRDEGHDWDGCICRICGKRKAASAPEHDWDGCTCRKCGHVLWEGSDAHDWNGCTCRKCGTVRNKEHDLDEKCLCRICGQEVHDWRFETEEIADEETFNEMGGGLENMWMMHQPGDTVWTCMRCGKVERNR